MLSHVTIITIPDRCDFDRVVLRRAMLGVVDHAAFNWGEEECERLLAEKAKAFKRSGDQADDPDYFDPHVTVSIVEVL